MTRTEDFTSIDAILDRLATSKFRASFSLKQKDRDYIDTKDLDTVRDHAKDFVAKRLAPAFIPNDGRQTPMRGHPVFIAQHACACCCRECLYKWYGIPKGIELSREQQQKIVATLMAWINREYSLMHHVN